MSEESSSYSPSSSSYSEEEVVSKKRGIPKQDSPLAELDELRETQKDIRDMLKKLDYYQRRSEECAEQLMGLRKREKGILSRVTVSVKAEMKSKRRKKTRNSIFDQQTTAGSTSSLAERFNEYVQQEYSRYVGTTSFFGK